MINWIKDQRLMDFSSVVEAGVFGSVVLRSLAPNDCDLYVVSTASVSSDEWRKVKQYIGSMRKSFYFKFGILLNVVLLTLNEWRENESFFLPRHAINLGNRLETVYMKVLDHYGHEKLPIKNLKEKQSYIGSHDREVPYCDGLGGDVPATRT